MLGYEFYTLGVYVLPISYVPEYVSGHIGFSYGLPLFVAGVMVKNRTAQGGPKHQPIPQPMPTTPNKPTTALQTPLPFITQLSIGDNRITDRNIFELLWETI